MTVQGIILVELVMNIYTMNQDDLWVKQKVCNTDKLSYFSIFLGRFYDYFRL